MDKAKYLPHLLELRRRFIQCAILFSVILIPLLILSSDLYSLVAVPLIKNLPQNGMLVATQVISPFTAPLKLAFYTSLLLTAPFWLYHLWAFVAPGLYPNEKRAIRPIILVSTTLFYIGVTFAHFVICPLSLHFFMQMAPKGVTIMTDISDYLSFVLVLYFAFGAAFQVPIITFLLLRTGIVSLETIKKQRSYIILGAFVVGMLLTPPDVISQILLAVPLLILFEGGLLLAKWLR